MVKVALAQISPRLGNIKDNLKKHIELIGKAKGEKAHFIVFPELSLSGYYARDIHFDVSKQMKEALEIIRKESKGIYVIFGFVEEDENLEGILYNSAALMSGKILNIHRKMYLPTYGMFEESRYFRMGKKSRIFETEHCKVGIAICEDVWHPELTQSLALKGAQIIFSLSASPFMSRESWEILNKARAIENTVFHVYVNNASTQDGIVFWGGSEIISPHGKRIAKLKYIEEDFGVFDIDLDEVRRARGSSMLLSDIRIECIEDYLDSYRKAFGE